MCKQNTNSELTKELAALHTNTRVVRLDSHFLPPPSEEEHAFWKYSTLRLLSWGSHFATPSRRAANCDPKAMLFDKAGRVLSRSQHISLVRVLPAGLCQLGGYTSSICPQRALLTAWHHMANFTGFPFTLRNSPLVGSNLGLWSTLRSKHFLKKFWKEFSVLLCKVYFKK